MDPKEISERADYYLNAFHEIDDRMREEERRASAIARREQRRYEIAKEQLKVWRYLMVREALDMTRDEMARESLHDADALLAELARTEMSREGEK